MDPFQILLIAWIISFFLFFLIFVLKIKIIIENRKVSWEKFPFLEIEGKIFFVIEHIKDNVFLICDIQDKNLQASEEEVPEIKIATKNDFKTKFQLSNYYKLDKEIVSEIYLEILSYYRKLVNN